MSAPDRDEQRLSRHLDRLEDRLPGPAARAAAWLRRPQSRIYRIPAGLLLVAGGFFSFLPILGLWMLPFGLLLLAIDIGPLRRPVGGAIVSAERWWVKWRRRRASAKGADTQAEP